MKERGSPNLWVLLLTILLSTPIAAIDRDRRVEQLHHRSWATKDGAPSDIRAIAQTTDGFLWLGTAMGLCRFDGIRFEYYQPQAGQVFPSTQVTSLLALPNGGLWVGFRFGGVSFLKDGKAIHYSKQDGLPVGLVRGIVRSRQGVIWAATMDGLARLEGSNWKRVGADWNFAGTCLSVFVDQRGTLWVGTRDALLFLPEGATKFLLAADHLKTVSKIAESPNGVLWMSEVGRSVRPVSMTWKEANSKQPEIRVGSAAVLFDDEGSLWITSLGDGLRRVPYPERLNGQKISEFSHTAEIFTQKDGLTSDFVESVFQDREGNMWISTNMGLDRFQQSSVVPVSLPSGASGLMLAAGDKGMVWVGSINRNLIRIQNGRIVAQAPFKPVNSIYSGLHGIEWIATGDKLIHFTHGRFSRQINLPGYMVTAVTEDRLGRLWVSADPGGGMRQENGHWESLEHLGGPGSPANAVFTDESSRIWFGFPNSTVVIVDGNTIRTLAGKGNVPVGNIMSVHGLGSKVYVGGDSGLAFFDGNRFRPVIPADKEAFGGISGIVASKTGDLWLSGNKGIIHIVKAELQRFEQNFEYQVNYQVCDFLDGLPAPLQKPFNVGPVAIEGTDGLLWFATTEGLCWINPKHLLHNALPPSVVILSVIADGKVYNPAESLKLPVRTTNLEIVYTGLSLSIPERVRFRYKLEGFDQHWQDAGTHRDTTYTNLGPGTYRFHVLACNNDGVWNDTGAAINLIIPPTILQSSWIRALWAISAVTLLWLLYQLRLRQLHEQLQSRLAERLSERERIARELHDTLLQSVQGLTLSFQAAAERVPANEPARPMLEQALQKSDRLLDEGRARVLSLRLSSPELKDLSLAFAAVGEDLAKDKSLQFFVRVNNASREVHPIVWDEIYRIGREAITNAVQHAEAHKVEVDILYNRANLKVIICDNGRGIDPTILAVGRRSGHWGLTGMRERAEKIGAHLEIRSRLDKGTEVKLIVPAGSAYRTEVSSKKWYRFRRSWRDM